MKKKIPAVLLALCLLISLAAAPRAAAASDVCFISLNDRLLDLGSKAEYVGGEWYVPCSVFADFNISYSYFANSSTFMVYSRDRQFFFDLEGGETYDAANNYYSAVGMLQNGITYVPVSFICTQFGLSWSYISGSGYGDICRIKDSSVVLDDSQFLSAAAGQMRDKYSAYTNALNPSVGGVQTQTPTGTRTVYLSFEGLPGEDTLNALNDWSVTATFFLTEDEITSGAQTVRRIAGEGHYIGIVCEDVYDYYGAAELLLDTARIKTLLITGEEEEQIRAMAARNGLVYCGYNVDGILDGRGLAASNYITAYTDGMLQSAPRILCTEATDANIAYLLNYFSENNTQVLPVNEIWNV